MQDRPAQFAIGTQFDEAAVAVLVALASLRDAALAARLALRAFALATPAYPGGRQCEPRHRQAQPCESHALQIQHQACQGQVVASGMPDEYEGLLARNYDALYSVTR